MSWQTISGDGFAPINVLEQIPMGSAQAQRFNKDRFYTFSIWYIVKYIISMPEEIIIIIIKFEAMLTICENV